MSRSVAVIGIGRMGWHIAAHLVAKGHPVAVCDAVAGTADRFATEVGVPDGPKPDEMVVILAMAIGGRVHARLAGGFTLADRGKPGVPA